MNDIEKEMILLGKRGSGKSVMMNHMLYEIGKKEQVKDIIKSNFARKNINLTNEELESEYLIVKSHLGLKHSHHMYSKYSLEHIIEIRKILNM
jgi:septin family protein